MLAKQKLEYTDFSAGISENTVPGKENAYATADNLLITRDRHLETRPGSTALSDQLYILPVPYQRVGALFNFYNDTMLLAQSGQDLFYQTGTTAPTWSTLFGPAGGHAFTHNTAYSRVAGAMWKQQLYLVSDSGESPQFFYFDNTGAAQLRTAGLPRPVIPALYTTSQLLVAGITLAVSLATSLKSHVDDFTVVHIAHDTVTSNAIAALTVPTNLATFQTYVAGLVTAYNEHLADALLDVAGPQVFHINEQKVYSPSLTMPWLGRYSTLNYLASTGLAPITDLNSALAVLNDLRTRYNFHTYSTLTHADAVTSLSTSGSYSTLQTGYGHYACPLPSIIQNTVITINTDPTDNLPASVFYSPAISGNLQPLWNFINQLKAEFNAHIANGTYHNNADTDNTIVVANCTDAFSATVLLAHLEFFYWWHYQDAAFTQTNVARTFHSFTGQYSSGDAAWNTASIDGSAFIGYVVVNTFAFNPFSSPWKITQLAAARNVMVTGGSSGVVNIGSTFSSTFASSTFRIATSQYHYDVAPVDGSYTTPVNYNARVLAYDLTLTNYAAIQASALALSALITTHELAQWANEATGTSQPLYFGTTTQTTSLFMMHNAPAGTGATWPEAQVRDYSTTAGFLDLLHAGAYFTTAAATTLPSSVIYTAVWRYNYTSGGLFFENDSTPSVYFSAPWVSAPIGPTPTLVSPFPVSLTGLPTLINPPGGNWDVANIKMDIYRTIPGGTSLFLVGTVANGTTTFTDTMPDLTLLSQEQLYTTGGVLNNDQPPASRFLVVLNSTAYYGYVTDITSGEVFPNRILQSIPSAPYAVPAENFDDLDDPLSGLSHYNNYVIAFCPTKIYRMEGAYDELGNGLLSHILVAPTVGCVSHFGIVQTEVGVFFCGTNGIYWTDGFQLTRVNLELEKTYLTLIQSPLQRARLSGVYDKGTRRIYWSFCSTPTSAECDIGWVLDLNYGLSDRMSFTTISGGSTFLPTAWVLFNNQLIRGTSYGFLFKHDAQYTSDQTPLLNQTSTPSTQWLPDPILYNFVSCQTNFGSSQVKKWVTRVTYQGQAKSNLYLQINRLNNNGGAWQPLTPVRSVSAIRWGDPAILWNDAVTAPLCTWGQTGMIDTFRKMPAGSLRCDWMAVQFKNASGIICGSDTYGKVHVSNLSGGSVNLTLPTPYQWPLWAVLYTIAFQNDGYVKPYAITFRNAQVIAVDDPDGTSPSGQSNVLWQISGMPYGQRFNLTAYNLTFAPLADEQSAYQGATSSDGGANAT